MRYSRILQYVNQVARTGSIRKAAEQLNATSTAVNKRIKDLEDELEVELFDRTPRGVSLTAAGEMFIHFVREQLSEEDRMRSRLDEMRGLRRGLVRIATSQALAGNFMPDLLAGFKKRSPNVAFHVLAATHSQAISALQEHEVELVLIYRPPRTYKLEPIFSINQRLMAVMNRNHPLANHPSLRLRDFAKYPVALPDGTIGGRQLLDDVTLRQDIRLSSLVVSNSLEFLRGCAAKFDVVCFQIEIGVPTRDLEPFDLVAKPIDRRDLLEAPLMLGQLRGRRLPIASATFAEYAAREMDRWSASTNSPQGARSNAESATTDDQHKSRTAQNRRRKAP